MLRKQYYLPLILALSLCFSFKAHSQVVLFNQNFEDTANLFQGYVLSNFDKGIPANTEWAPLGDSAWVVRYLSGFNTHAAVATSNYDSAVAANDWFITPAINLGKASRLSWKAMSLTPGKPDSYEVYVSTSTQSASGCLINFPFYSVASEQSGLFKQYTLDLADSGYADQPIYIGFRLTTLSGDLLAVDDIKVTDDSLPSLASLTFVVNMSKYIAAGNFRPRTDTVDVAGNFNSWDGTQNIMGLVANSDSSIYSITIPGFHDGDQLQFKFRINSSWNDTSVEFPYGGPNRLWTIADGKYTYTAFYNENGVVSSIPDAMESLDGVKIFPNPVGDELTILPVSDIRLILMVSLNGQKIREFRDPGNKLLVDTSGLPTGTYILLFYSRQGLIGGRKIMRY